MVASIQSAEALHKCGQFDQIELVCRYSWIRQNSAAL
jgi:hypothetical protein